MQRCRHRPPASCRRKDQYLRHRRSRPSSRHPTRPPACAIFSANTSAAPRRVRYRTAFFMPCSASSAIMATLNRPLSRACAPRPSREPRLLDQVDAPPLRGQQHAPRRRLAPGLIHRPPRRRDLRALLDGRHVGHVVVPGRRPIFSLKNVVSARSAHLLGFFDVALGVPTGQRPATGNVLF